MSGLFSATSLAPLQARSAEAMTERAILETPVQVEVPGTGGQYTTTWDSEPEEPCRFRVAGAGGTNLRADRPTAVGDYELTLGPDRPMQIGQRALVRGRTPNGEAWQKLVSISKVVGPLRIYSRALCVDYVVD